MSWYNPFQWNWVQASLKKVMDNNSYMRGKKTFVSLKGKEFFFDMQSEEDFLVAYNKCSPLKSIINKRAGMFINGNVEILNKNTDKKQRGSQARQLRDLMKRPNITQTWKQFFAQFHIYIDLFGYCPVLKIKPAGMENTPGEISSLWCLPPWLFNVKFTGKYFNQTQLKDLYKQFTINWGGGERELDIDSVIIVLDGSISTDSDGYLFIPDSRWKSHEEEVTNTIAAYKSRGSLIKKKGAMGVLSNIGKDSSGPLKLQDEDKQALQEDFARYGLQGEDWQVIVTDASLQWQSMSFPTKDMMLFEEIEDNILRMCDGGGLYPDLMGSIKKSTFANLNEAKKAQYQDYIIPDSNQRIEQLTPFLLEDGTSYFTVDFSHLEILQQSAKEKADALVSTNTAYESLYRNGLCTKDQWADAANLPSVGPDGAKYIYEVDNTPLAVKLGVGGTEALMTVLQSSLKADQKKNVMIIVFGISDQDAEKMKGEDAEPDPTAMPFGKGGQEKKKEEVANA